MRVRLQTAEAHELVVDVKSEVHVLLAHDHWHRFLEAAHNVGLAEATQ